MKVVVQRVKNAAVRIDGKIHAQIGRGYVLLIGIGQHDHEVDADYLSEKIAHLRIFQDENDKMNISILKANGEILAISQFTLFADTRKGRRPSFIKAASPEKGEQLYQYFIQLLKKQNITVKEGVFGAMMQVELNNDGPVTIILDSTEK